MTTGKAAVGILAALAAGAALGVLFAPDKGSKTRMKFTRSGSDKMDEIKDKVDEVLDNLTTKFQTAKEEVTHLLYQNGKKKADEISKNVANT